VDPVGLVRSKRFRGDPMSLGHYVNDRPYAASSMLAVAIGTVFRSAMSGRSEAFPELAASPMPLHIEIPVVSAGGNQRDLARRLFEGCGWQYAEDVVPLDPAFPEWGASRYRSVELRGIVPLSHALRQLYVLLPVLDDSKHYWVGDAEVEKLTRAGDGWLATHPERELITRRYLLNQRDLVARSEAAQDLAPEDPARDEASAVRPQTVTGTREQPDAATQGVPLRIQRAEAVLDVLHEVRAHTVIDMGCGPGALLTRLAGDRSFTRIVGSDVSARSLEQAARALKLDRASDVQRERIELLHGSVVYRDTRLQGFDAMVLMEVIEHVDPSRLDALEDSVFVCARPGAVIVTTPNVEYNRLYPDLEHGGARHDDHRFEWTRAEFRAWAEGVAERRGYSVGFRPIGGEHPDCGAPTQLALFRREAA
jgi:3' terminal RNA ribose 2'-O-methyltransferase Hen1